MEKINTLIDKKAILQMSKKGIIFTSIVAFVGLASTIPFFILTLTMEKQTIPLIGLIVSSAILVVGLYSAFNLIMTIKKAKKANANITIEFLDDHIVAYMFKGNVSVDQLSFKYNDLFGYKVTKDFIFIYLNQKHSLPVDKSVGEQIIVDYLNSKGLKRL